MMSRILFVISRNVNNRHIHINRTPLLAGHSKWANIKHTKALKDGQKAALFTKLSRQIRLAVQDAGGNPEMNSQLKSVVEEALRKNMPMATIQNSIKKSQQTKTDIKEYHLELRYKQKVFAICVLYTDNFPALKMDLAPIIRKAGASYVDVSHMFDDFGLIEAKLDAAGSLAAAQMEARATDDAIECGAEEVEIADESSGIVNFICSPIEINTIRKALEKKGYLIESSEHIYAAKNVVQLTSEELVGYEAFLKKLRDVPGVENIFDNVQFDST